MPHTQPHYPTHPWLFYTQEIILHILDYSILKKLSYTSLIILHSRNYPTHPWLFYTQEIILHILDYSSLKKLSYTSLILLHPKIIQYIQDYSTLKKLSYTSRIILHLRIIQIPKIGVLQCTALRINGIKNMKTGVVLHWEKI